jgi:hypothetical protein
MIASLKCPLIERQCLLTAADTRLLVAISFHFAQERFGYLEEVLRTLANFAVRKRNIVVFTNTADATAQEALRQVFRRAHLADRQDARVMSETNLTHPFDLTWMHKRLITDEFLAPESPYTHFIYLEDDECLTFENFAYFLAARDILRPFALVPAFLRTEWSKARRLYVNTDNLSPVILRDRPFVAARGHAFCCADNPYHGAFILDRELAQEYAASRSFDPYRSREVIHFDTRERAAMGLTFEAPPPPFTYRVVVPVSIATRAAPRCAWLMHLPDNYANDPDSPFGKIAMTDLFEGDFSPAFRNVINQPPRAGTNSERQVTAKNHYGRAAAAVTAWCGFNRHEPMPDQSAHLTPIMPGSYGHYGISGNFRRISWYAYQVAGIWQKWLSRRDRGTH